MKVDLKYVILFIFFVVVMSCTCMTTPAESRSREVPNVNFKLERQINKSNPRKQETMHIFSNMEVPGWKWGKLYA